MKVRRVEDYEKHTDELLEMFRLTELQDRDGRLLSGGQMRRASLAIGIALQPEILLLDEPTANLDIATRREIMKTLQMLKGVTDTVVIATHDMQLVCDWAGASDRTVIRLCDRRRHKGRNLWPICMCVSRSVSVRRRSTIWACAGD